VFNNIINPTTYQELFTFLFIIGSIHFVCIVKTLSISSDEFDEIYNWNWEFVFEEEINETVDTVPTEPEPENNNKNIDWSKFDGNV